MPVMEAKALPKNFLGVSKLVMLEWVVTAVSLRSVKCSMYQPGGTFGILRA